MPLNIVEKIQGIYAITADSALNLSQIENIIIRHNVSILQYRRKTATNALKLIEATKLRQLCLQHHTLFIINDDINLAQKVEADGVHLGKKDDSIQQAKAQLGKNSLVGVSCYDDIDMALEAQFKGANYVAFGALFSSNTKPNAGKCSLNVIKQVKQILSIPIVGIGGIDFNNQQQAFDAGCDAVAMIETLWKASKHTH